MFTRNIVSSCLTLEERRLIKHSRITELWAFCIYFPCFNSFQFKTARTWSLLLSRWGRGRVGWGWGRGKCSRSHCTLISCFFSSCRNTRQKLRLTRRARDMKYRPQGFIPRCTFYPLHCKQTE